MGRPRQTNITQSLQMARLHYADGMSYSEIADKFALGTKNTVCNRLKEVRAEYPEFIQSMKEIQSYIPEAPAEIAAVVLTTELDKLVETNAELADTIRDQVATLIDIPKEQIQNMKAEHRLRHIPALITVMRLLNEESTANVKKVSLIECVGLATKRRER